MPTATHTSPLQGSGPSPLISPEIALGQQSEQPRKWRLFDTFSLDPSRLLGTGACILFLCVCATLGGPPPHLWWFVGGVVLVFIARALWLRIRQNRTWWDSLPRTVRHSARVGCVGNVVDFEKLLARGPLVPQSFEPVTLTAPFALGVTTREKITAGVLIACLIAACILLMPRYLFQATGVYVLWFALSPIAAYLTAFIWPVYIRVVPGRLDVFESSFLGRHVRVAQMLCLRRNAVLVDLNTDIIFIASTVNTVEISIRTVHDRIEFARAVLLAATSEASVPDLPNDALIG